MMRDQELAGLAMTLGRDAKIKITVGGDTSFCQPDGSHINIARMPSTPVGRMLMTGLVFHEVGHKNYTQGGRPNGLLGDMMNVIEDIRVDLETVKARPGTCFNLEAVTTHYVNKGSLEPKSLPHALLGKVMAYGFGRIMAHKAILPLETVCNEMMDDAFGEDFIADVEKIITDLPHLRSTNESSVMAQQLIDLLVLQQQQPPKSSSSTSSTSSGKSSPPSPLMPPPEPHEDSEGDAPTEGQEDSVDDSELEGQQADMDGPSSEQPDAPTPGDETPQQPDDSQVDVPEDPGQEAGFGGDGAGAGGGNRPTPEEIETMLKNKTGYGDLSALIQSELDEMADGLPVNKRGCIPMLPVIGKLKSLHGKLNEVEAVSASSRMRARMLGMLQALKRQPKSYGLSGRKLAYGRLPKMAVGDPRIFLKKVETVAVNTAVTVLLDLSGSMSDKYEVANAAAFALHYTLFGLKGVAVSSVEFSGKDRQPEVNILVDFGVKPLSENFNHYPFDGTPTHNAIWAARAMLLQRREPRKIMLILTDGCPDSSMETTAATQKTMKDGIEIAAIGIMNDNVRHFWTSHKVINTIQELPPAMFGVMESLLMKR